MNKQRLLQRLQDIEWDNFEAKSAQTDIPKDVWETVSAFANTSGGWIVFGVSQKKKVFEIVGVEDPEKIENDMLTTLRSKTKFNVKLSPQAKKYKLDNETFNRKLHIVKNGKLTYGGLLFLGKNEEINDHIDDFRIDYLEIPGTSYANAEPRYTYRIAEQENLWEYYFVLFQRLRIYANNPLTISEMGIGHEGALPRPVEELLTADESYPRNPVLAKFFRIARLCESAGYGFDKMLEWKHQTKNDVIFESTVDKTKFTFMLDTTKAHLENDKETDMKTDESVQKTTENGTKNIKTAQKTVQKNGIEDTETTKKTQKNYQENQKTTKKILIILAEKPNISMREIAEKLNLTNDGVIWQINKLKSQGIIRREGADKGGKWVIIKPD